MLVNIPAPWSIWDIIEYTWRIPLQSWDPLASSSRHDRLVIATLRTHDQVAVGSRWKWRTIHDETSITNGDEHLYDRLCQAPGLVEWWLSEMQQPPCNDLGGFRYCFFPMCFWDCDYGHFQRTVTLRIAHLTRKNGHQFSTGWERTCEQGPDVTHEKTYPMVI
jgi:hypothetical protein